MIKKSYCIFLMFLIIGCSAIPSITALKDTKTIVLGSYRLQTIKLPAGLNLFNHTEFKFLDKQGAVLGVKTYRGNFYKVKLDKNNYYFVSSDKIIKGSLTDQSEITYNFEPSLNAIDSQIYLFEEDLYLIDNQGFRSKPTNYLTSIYKNNNKLFDIVDDQAVSLVVMDSYIYVLTKNNHNYKKIPNEVSCEIFTGKIQRIKRLRKWNMNLNQAIILPN